MKSILIKIISFYQKTLSPDHGALRKVFPHGYCKYHPTCSEYTKRSIKMFGSIKGISLGFWRIVRCNPLSKGGVDEPANSANRQFIFGALALLIYATMFFMLLLVVIKYLY